MGKEYDYDNNSDEFRIEFFEKYLRKNIEKKSQVKIPQPFKHLLKEDVD